MCRIKFIIKQIILYLALPPPSIFMGMNPYMNSMNSMGMPNSMMMNQWNPYQPYNPYTQYNPWMYGMPNYNQT